MPVWNEKNGKGWRYRFQYQGKFHNKAWFKTKAEARAAEAVHKAELIRAEKTPTIPTATGFLTVSNQYLDYSERRHAEKTHKYKKYVCQSFLEFAGDVPVDRITIGLLESYLKTRKTNVNYNRHRKDLCALFTWAWRRRLIQEHPCHFLERMPEPKFTRMIPTPEEVRRLFLAAGEQRPFLLVIYHTLARIDEVLRTRWEDVNFERREITLWTRKRKDGAWASDILPMNQVLYQTLRGLWKSRAQDEWVFFNEMTGTRYQKRPKLMRGLCRLAGIRHFGFHAIRHYVASLLHDSKKVSLPQVSKLLRHTSKATTERYLQVVDPHSRAAIEALEGDFTAHLPMTPSHTGEAD